MEGFQGGEAAGGEVSLTLRWLGVAGIEIQAGEQVLAIDPFFTRPTLLEMFQPVTSNGDLVAEKLPHCNAVLVTHAHYDHLLDVHQVQLGTGAVGYGSANACQLLRLHGVAENQVKQVQVGDILHLGAFHVEVIQGQHSTLPLGRVFSGNLRPGLHPPLRVQDYRMDICLGYLITVMGMRVLVCAAEPHPADILFIVAQETRRYYLKLFKETQPQTVIPIHWDNFTRPLQKPLQRFTRPGRLPLWQLAMLARQTIPGVNVIIPEIFRKYTIRMPGA